MLWIALTQWRGPLAREVLGRGALGVRPPALLRSMARLSVASVALTILAGGFVAGLHAGLTYNTFPLMDGRLVPEGYAALTPVWRNLIGNVAAVQFDHRVLATAALLLATATAATGLARLPHGATRMALAALGGAAVAQYALGVATLLSVVRVDLAISHQVGAVLLLTASLVAAHHLGRRAAP